jgi:hypothetical protein
MIEDQIKLLAFQQTLEQESPGKVFIGLSVNGTIRSSLLAGLAKKADKVRSDFKVPDKRSVPLSHLPLFAAHRALQILVHQDEDPRRAARMGRP